MSETITITERYVSFGGRTYMESSLYPGVWREVPIVLFRKVEWPWEDRKETPGKGIQTP